MNEVLQLQPELAGLKTRGVDFYIVSLDSDKELKSFFTEKKITATIIRDQNASIFKAYQVDGIPNSFYFDKKGKLRDQTLGWGEGFLAKFKQKALALADEK